MNEMPDARWSFSSVIRRSIWALFILGVTARATWIANDNILNWRTNVVTGPVRDGEASLSLFAFPGLDDSPTWGSAIEFHTTISSDAPYGNFNGWSQPSVYGTQAPYLGSSPGSGNFPPPTAEGNATYLCFTSDHPAPLLSEGQSISIPLHCRASWQHDTFFRDTPYIQGSLNLTRRGSMLKGQFEVSAHLIYIRTDAKGDEDVTPSDWSNESLWTAVPAELKFDVETIAPQTDLTAHAVIPAIRANATPSVGIDEPLLPISQLGTLASATDDAVEGMIADGVTPLLIRLHKRNSGSTPLSYRFTPSVVSGGTISPLIVNVLKDGEWTWLDLSGNLQTTTERLSPADSGQHAFAFVHPIPAEALAFSQGSKEIVCEIVAEQLGPDGQPNGNADSLRFKVRKPPVVLVHGFRSDSDTWGSQFFDKLKLDRFVHTVEYGVTGSGVARDHNLNTNGSLRLNAWLLDEVLREEIEQVYTGFAGTRYDIVAHSQGGVLVRMLCQDLRAGNPAFARNSFRSADNGYRGRFRRIISIGSPHNGSRIVPYLQELRDSGVLYGLVPKGMQFFDLLQPKFNPYGDEVREANNRYKPVDPSARFHTLSSAIDGGMPPSQDSSLQWDLALAHQITGTPLTRGQIVLPNGWDGVVDKKSQQGGIGTRTTHVSDHVSHSRPEYAFGVQQGATETADAGVAERVITLLNGPASEFGPFVIPEPLADEAAIRGAAPHSLLFDVIDWIVPDLSLPLPSPPPGQQIHELRLNPVDGEPLAGPPLWFVEVLGEKGATNEGATVEPYGGDPERVTIRVDAVVKGDVVLYASYRSTTGKLIVARPLLVASIAPESPLTGIAVFPSNCELKAGNFIRVDAFGVHASGARSPLFLDAVNSTFSSSVPEIASVDAQGVVRAHQPGQALVSLSTRGFTGTITVTVTAVSPPLILRQPDSVVATSGDRVELFVVADGEGSPLEYRWHQNGVEIPGKTGDSLTIESVNQADVGVYSVRVSSSGGSIDSADALLAVDGISMIGPDAAGYFARHGPGSPMQDISGIGTSILQHSDDAAIAVPIGFSFRFYGRSHSSAHLSSNGLISFNAAHTEYRNADLSAAAAERPMIAVLWDDWFTDKTEADRVYYATLGEPGSRHFIVQWIVHRSTAPAPQGATIFQCRLSEATGEITMSYPDLESGAAASDFAASATVGIADQGGLEGGRFLQWSFNRQSLVNGDSLSFLPANTSVGHAANWRFTHFGSSAAIGPAGDDQDPDHDGMVNLLERALGSNPLHGEPNPWSLSLEAGVWRFRYTRSAAARADGMSFNVECSPGITPGSWSGAGVIESFTTTPDELEQVTATLPPYVGTHRFARLRVAPTP